MAEKGTFDARMAALAKSVGTGRLVGTLTRDQPYAQNQHENLTFKHPGGGQAKYQEGPLFGHHRTYLQNIADDVLEGKIVTAMAAQLERFDRDSARVTPRDYTILARSGHPRVRSGVRTLYDRPPEAPRLSVQDQAGIRANVRGITSVPSNRPATGRSNRPGG